MKNKFKIFLALLIAAIMCFVTACNKGSNNNSDNNGNNGNDLTTEESDIEYSKTNAIARNGQTNYRIIIADNATGTEVRAAAELSDYINLSTGASLPIFKESIIKDISTDMNLISVGKTKLMEKAGLDYSNVDFNKDGFIQKTVGRTLFLCGGQSQRSHLYAVYDLLEKCLGVRFFTPECEKVPANQNLNLPLLDVVDIPAFGTRFVTYDSLMDKDFSVKARLNTSLSHETTQEYGEGAGYYFWNEPHNITNTVIKHAIYKDSHPEWFYDSGGYINFIPTYGVKEDGTYDDTLEVNPVDIAFETIKDAMMSTPEETYFYHCSQSDGGVAPTNSDFVKRAQKIGQSGVYIQFNNLVCEKLNEWIESETRPDGLFPNGKEYKLLMFAYMITKNPPLNESGEPAVKLNDNLAVWVAPIDANLMYSINDPLQHSAEREMLGGWFKCTKNICIWDYYAHFWNDFNLYYTSYITTAQQSYQYYVESGVKDYVLTQMAGHSISPRSAAPELRTYLASKLMWDPYRYNAWDLVREYCDYFYGEYSDDILKIIYNIEDNLAILKNDGVYRYMNHTWTNHSQFYPLNILTNGIDIIDENLKDLENSALSAEEKIVMRERLEEFELMLLSHIVTEYSSYYNGDMVGYPAVADKFFKLIDSTHYTTDFFGEGTGNLTTKRFNGLLESSFLY